MANAAIWKTLLVQGSRSNGSHVNFATSISQQRWRMEPGAAAGRRGQVRAAATQETPATPATPATPTAETSKAIRETVKREKYDKEL